MRKEFEKALSYAITEGDEDDIGLWEITGILCSALGLNSFKLSGPDTEKLFQALSEFIPILLQNGFVVSNFKKGTGYIVWPDQSPDSVVERIRQEWIRLKGMKPDVNFIAYFRKTNKQPVNHSRP